MASEFDTRSRTSTSTRGSRRSRKRREEVSDFQMFLMDNSTNEYITPEKIDARGAPKRFVLIIQQDQPYKVKIKISSGAWETNSFNWFHVELLIDGQHITRRFLQRPYGDEPVEFCFDSDPAGRSFIFDSRHDGSEGPSDHIEDKDEVGQIVVRFRRAAAIRDRDRNQKKRFRRNHDFHANSQFQIREADKKRMDITTKEKKSTMRTKYGPSQRNFDRSQRGRHSSGPPAKVIDEDDIVAECSTMYDSAEAFELRNWINPLLHHKFRKYFPGRDFDDEERIYYENQQKVAFECDLTGERAVWGEKKSSVKREANYDQGVIDLHDD